MLWQRLTSRVTPLKALVPPLGLLVPILIAAALLAGAACSSPASFRGTTLNPPDPAPPFTLKDQFGRSVSLSDFSGKVVALTFLYTNCPDICPIITENLHQTYSLLGDATDEVAFVAISVDPERDSVEQAYRYSQQKEMLSKWAYLVGSRKQLAPIWAAYYVAAEPDPVVQDGEVDQSTASPGEGVGGDTNAHDGDDFYTVSHSAPVYLIDRRGNRRIIFTGLSLDPQPLVHDIRLLLGEPP